MIDIITPRLTITPFREVHLKERYVNWLNDPDLVCYSEQRHRRHTLESCREYMLSYADSGNFFWAIELSSAGNLHIGNINAMVDRFNSLADVGILIGEKSQWNKGLGTEAFQGVIDFLIGERQLRKITAGTMSENVGMLRVMRQCGLTEEGRKKGQFLLDGKEVDLVYAGLFRRDWERAVSQSAENNTVE